MYLHILLIGAVIVVSGITTWTDIRERRIGNIWTFGLIGLTLATGLYLTLSNQIGYLSLLRSLTLGFLVSFAMYYVGLWSAGDAKLFWAVFFALSLAFPETFTLYNLLVNTFVPAFVFLFIYLIVKTSSEEKTQVIWGIIRNYKQLLQLALSLTSIMGLGIFLSSVLPINLGYVGNLFLFIFLFILLQKFLSQKVQIFILLLFVPFVVLTFKTQPGLLLIHVGLTFVLFLVFRYFALGLGEGIFSEEVPIANLREKMVPDGYIVRSADGEYKWVTAGSTSLLGFATPPKEGEIILGMGSGPLSKATIQKLKELNDQGYFETFGNKICVHKTICYAPFIAFGVFLTLILGGENFARVITSLL